MLTKFQINELLQLQKFMVNPNTFVSPDHWFFVGLPTKYAQSPKDTVG